MTTFPNGQGINAGSELPPEVAQHLCMQYHNVVDTELMLIFFITNVKMRHHVIRNSTMYVNKQEEEYITGLVSSPASMKRVVDAAANPHSRESRELLGKLESTLSHIHSNVPFSSLNARGSQKELYSMLRFFGAPSVWCTISAYVYIGLRAHYTHLDLRVTLLILCIHVEMISRRGSCGMR